DWSENTADNPAVPGTEMRILLTGLAGANAGSVFVKLYGRNIIPTSAGPADGLMGIDEVAFNVPTDLPLVITPIAVCGYTPSNPTAEVCSPATDVAITALE